MSEDREMKTGGRSADDTPTDEEVRAHVKGGRQANDEGGDDVEAHVKGGRQANDEGGDDVEAHVKSSR